MNFQIGKNGVNDNVIQSLKNAFKTRKVVRISVLKAAGPTKDAVRMMANDISTRLGGNFTYTLIGFTIILRRRASVDKASVRRR